jgi:hypothetical protein
MDNKIFNVNGKTKNQLKLALKLLLSSEYNDGEDQKVQGWYYRKDKGFIITWHCEESNKDCKKFVDRLGKPNPPSTEELADILWDWLKTDEAKSTELGRWENDEDHDGSNSIGWRLYTEQWGCIENVHGTIDHYSIAAIKPVYLWYGK